MEKFSELDAQRYISLKKELEKTAFDKLKKIENLILTKSSGSHSQDVQILLMVNDELDDVLLNWDVSQISSFTKSNLDFDLDEY